MTDNTIRVTALAAVVCVCFFLAACGGGGGGGGGGGVQSVTPYRLVLASAPVTDSAANTVTMVVDFSVGKSAGVGSSVPITVVTPGGSVGVAGGVNNLQNVGVGEFLQPAHANIYEILRRHRGGISTRELPQLLGQFGVTLKPAHALIVSGLPPVLSFSDLQSRLAAFNVTLSGFHATALSALASPSPASNELITNALVSLGYTNPAIHAVAVEVIRDFPAVDIRQNVYVADFSGSTCAGISLSMGSGNTTTARHYAVSCLNAENSAIATATVYKQTNALAPVCWRDSSRILRCRLKDSSIGDEFVALAFPKQNYRRDDGKCESAPFYAVANCQRENVVNVGGFLAFVSGLNGVGYRQFGVRHKWQMDDWQIAGLVSHAKGEKFSDTWWGRMRIDRPLFYGVRGFAEYESGVTSLRHNGRLLSRLPIAGGRVGIGFDELTMSFGRPMHYKGRGDSAAAIYWRFDDDSNLGLLHTGGDVAFHGEWRWRF